MIRHYGLIGYPLEHSLSPGYFAQKFAEKGIRDADYTAFALKNIRSIRAFVRSNDLSGFNVTIPYKTDIMSYLDELSEAAASIGAVNTVCVRHCSGRLFLKGYNTDAPAFTETITAYIPNLNIKALVFGTGGASRAVCYSLEKLKIPYRIVSRNPMHEGQIATEDIDECLMKEHELIINTTPLGMFPDVSSCPPLPYQYLTAEHYLYDLIYNPAETVFLRKGRLAGATIRNGLEMLRIQADHSWNIWCEAIRETG